MFTEEEVRQELEKAFAALPPFVQVVFANQRCQACGQVSVYYKLFFLTILVLSFHSLYCQY